MSPPARARATGLDLPVRRVVPEVLSALARCGVAVLVAPPGTGKTTIVPLALAGLIDPAGPGSAEADAAQVSAAPADAARRNTAPADAASPPSVVRGRVLVAEPRRLATRAAAARMADLIGEKVGGRVGYSVRGESRTSGATRVEVVTTGLLVRRLQRDPELPGIAAIMIDECHERHLDTDLALAFAVDVRAGLRPDLLLLAASATAEAGRIAATLGSDGGPDPRPAPVIGTAGGLHEVRVAWCPPPAGITPGSRVDPRLLDHVAQVIRRALAEEAGDVLAFLPGAGEIGAVAARLGGLAGVEVMPLHGRLPAAVQDAALRPIPGRRRVVLATDVAESSLTVPGVRLVVDAGLARVPRLDLARGLGALTTVRASQAASTQRAGRAGRQGPGVVYRCWSTADHERLPAHPEPEVACADLTSFALQLACWGSPGGRGLALLDPPPAAAFDVASETLRDLAAVDDSGLATARGRALAAVGAHPRLARAMLDGAAAVGTQRAADVVAVLSDDAPSAGGDDLTAVWRSLRSGGDRGASARWREETRRLLRAIPPTGPEAASRAGSAAFPGSGARSAPGSAPGPAPGSARGARPDEARGRGATLPDDLAAATVVGLAFPERLARLRREGGRTYLMASGTAAELAEGSALVGAPWLAIAVADRFPGRRDARIRLAAPLDEATARAVGASLLTRGPDVTWADGAVRAREVERLGAITLTERPLDHPDPALVAAAVAEGLRREGLAVLRWTTAASLLRQRLAACHAGIGDPWPAMDDAALLSRIDLSGVRTRTALHRLDVVAALRALVPPHLIGQLDRVAPERVEVPSGSRIAVDYTDADAPALPVKLQEVFGWTTVPLVAGRPLRLHLLSPAGRPVAVTSDLESFWRNGYVAVRAQLRGRYPRHPWPEDPFTAPPTRRTTPRR